MRLQCCAQEIAGDSFSVVANLVGHPALGSISRREFDVPIARQSSAVLQPCDQPGNVRELEHLIRRAVVLCEGDVIEASDLPLSADAAALLPTEPTPEGKSERQQLLEALGTCNWIVYGDRGAARLLGMHPEKLRYRMSKYGLRRPGPS